MSACGKHLRSVPTPPAPPRCQFGNQSYALGDIVRLGGSDCRSCVCSAPPHLTCTTTRCSLQSFFPPRGASNCIMQKDELGCCDIGYKCDSDPTPGAQPPRAGGFPVLGGFGREPVGQEQKMLAVFATQKLLAGVGSAPHCPHSPQLLEILQVERQVVAGTNFRLKLRLRAREGEDCEERTERVCQDILVFRPLPFACEPSPENPDCLAVSRPDQIVCN